MGVETIVPALVALEETVTLPPVLVANPVGAPVVQRIGGGGQLRAGAYRPRTRG